MVVAVGRRTVIARHGGHEPSQLAVDRLVCHDVAPEREELMSRSSG